MTNAKPTNRTPKRKYEFKHPAFIKKNLKIYKWKITWDKGEAAFTTQPVSKEIFEELLQKSKEEYKRKFKDIFIELLND